MPVLANLQVFDIFKHFHGEYHGPTYDQGVDFNICLVAQHASCNVGVFAFVHTDYYMIGFF
jgi:hypothetical protein